jgi:hypothetical protein
MVHADANWLTGRPAVRESEHADGYAQNGGHENRPDMGLFHGVLIGTVAGDLYFFNFLALVPSGQPSTQMLYPARI